MTSQDETRFQTMKLSFAAVCCATLLLACGTDDRSAGPDSAVDSGPDVGTSLPPTVPGSDAFPAVPLWGDTHLHTSLSFDVYLFGTPAATPDTAYRFAKGEAVESPTVGQTWQLKRPLDFLVVADHAEVLGSMSALFEGDETFAATKSGRAILDVAGDSSDEGLLKAYSYLARVGSGKSEPGEITPQEAYVDLHGGTKRQNVWHQIIDAAERHNAPGEFTAFIGWEWTSQPGGANLHRVVFSPTDGETAKQFLPYSQLEGPKPEQLWAWLDETSTRTGADFIAIPHNSNLSMGLMFASEDSEGNPITADYANTRMRWERVVESTQIKGDSETHPMLSPADEFADYETYNFVMIPSGPTPDPEIGDYVRSSLRRGLEIEARVGVNPYKFGLAGSTDSHTGISAIDEDNFAGKGQKDSAPERRSNPTGLGSSRGWDMGAAGFVAAWSPENSRQAIFDTFKRREVYSTTGTRINLRFFGGWDYDEADLAADVFPESGYAKGVPMGGELADAEGSSAPAFLLVARKDPDGANLDRIQVVKGWLDDGGHSHEKVFDVAWSTGRETGNDGKLAPVGNTVDLATGDYSNSIGAIELQTVWTDPEFDASLDTFYYVRVLEIPTPRYSLLNTIAMGIDYTETGQPATIQERAYSSPIWFTSAE